MSIALRAHNGALSAHVQQHNGGAHPEAALLDAVGGCNLANAVKAL